MFVSSYYDELTEKKVQEFFFDLNVIYPDKWEKDPQDRIWKVTSARNFI